MASKRLIRELDAYNREPSPAVSALRLTSDDDLFHLNAVLLGPEETAYEGTSRACINDFKLIIADAFRRCLQSHHLRTSQLPSLSTGYPLSNPVLPPQC